MRRVAVITAALLLVAVGFPVVSSAVAVARVCWPAVTIPAVTIPAVTIPAVTVPAVTIPRTCFNGVCYPAHTYPARTYPAISYPARTYPARTYPARCFSSPAALSPAQTTVRISGYEKLDAGYSAQLSSRYWRRAGTAASYPNTYASGFGELNAAGFPKNQYVRSYVRRDGTFVNGYWRNSPTDGLPTCRIISC